ncbi:hypothetical protein PMAA_049990 [Talaromyces marneffei ATCC 18224]|uniref:Uncharacterized protein n=1 Tax=Talaromyces marneffei (strain ATCC 18224 / CBS 334.59 / QM 7333) TaxID=441960 RepID=B6QNU8_TALMQ|nr:hypothetical protein PMAA_049990 [Talaromyces marneffei ATCC 18224]
MPPTTVIWKPPSSLHRLTEYLETALDAYNDAIGSQTKIVDCWDQLLADHLDNVDWWTWRISGFRQRPLNSGQKVLVTIQGLRRSMAKHMKLGLTDLM